MACLEKGIDLDLILEKWHVSQLEELDGDSAQQVREWLTGQQPERSPLRATSDEQLGAHFRRPTAAQCYDGRTKSLYA